MSWVMALPPPFAAALRSFAALSSVWVGIVTMSKVYLYRRRERLGLTSSHAWACPGQPLHHGSTTIGLHVLFMVYMLGRVLGWVPHAPTVLVLHLVHFALMVPANPVFGLRGLPAYWLNMSGMAVCALIDRASIPPCTQIPLVFALQLSSGFWLRPRYESTLPVLAALLLLSPGIWRIVQRHLRVQDSLGILQSQPPFSAHALYQPGTQWSSYVQSFRRGEPQSRLVICALLVFYLPFFVISWEETFVQELVASAKSDAKTTQELMQVAKDTGALDYMNPPVRPSHTCKTSFDSLLTGHVCLTHLAISLDVAVALARLPPEGLLYRLLWPFYRHSTTVFSVFGEGVFKAHAVVRDTTVSETLTWLEKEAAVWADPEVFAAYLDYIEDAPKRMRPLDKQVAACLYTCREIVDAAWREEPPCRAEVCSLLQALPFAERLSNSSCDIDGNARRIVILLIMEVMVLHALRGEVAYTSGLVFACFTDFGRVLPTSVWRDNIGPVLLSLQEYGGRNEYQDKWGLVEAARQALPEFPWPCTLKRHHLSTCLT